MRNGGSAGQDKRGRFRLMQDARSCFRMSRLLLNKEIMGEEKFSLLTIINCLAIHSLSMSRALWKSAFVKCTSITFLVLPGCSEDLVLVLSHLSKGNCFVTCVYLLLVYIYITSNYTRDEG